MNYLIYGSSYNLVNEEIKKLIGEENATTYSLEEVSLAEVLEDVSYNSMFDEHKIIILKNFEVLLSSKKDNEANLERLIDYLKSPSKETMLILLSSEKVSSRGTTKELVANLEVIETPIITKSYELSKIFGALIKRDGYGITPNALNNFCEKCASNYDVALNEYNKLKKTKGKNKLISEEDVENYVANYNMNDLFGFKDAIINKNIEKALRMLDDLESSKIEIVPLVVMLAKEYQIVYNIKLLASRRMTNDQISEDLGKLHPYRVKILREAGNKYSVEELERLILYLCNLDLKLVSEDNLGFDELRKFLLQL